MLLRDLTDYFEVYDGSQYDVAWRRGDTALSFFVKFEEEGSLVGYLPFLLDAVDKWANLKVVGGKYTYHYSVAIVKGEVYVLVGKLVGTNHRMFDFYEFPTLSDAHYFVAQTVIDEARKNEEINISDYVKLVSKNS